VLKLPANAPDSTTYYSFAVKVHGTNGGRTFACTTQDPVIGNGRY
jgi:hypothetical protein